MSTYDCFIRIRLLLTDELKPDRDGIGHFDLQINKANFHFESKTYNNYSETKITRSYTNPIISYGGGGYVTVCDASNDTMIDKTMMCKHKIIGNDQGVDEIIDWLEKYCEFDSEKSSNIVHKYKVTSGKFKTYEKADRSCFACAAVWCELLGYSTLMNIYNENTYPKGKLDSNGYKKYTAWPMFRTYHRSWIFDKLRV